MMHSAKSPLFIFLAMMMSLQMVSGQRIPATITGKLTNNTVKQASLYYSGKDSKLIKQASIDTTGRFLLTFDLSQTDIFKLQFENGMYITLVMDPGENANINVDFADFSGTLVVTGSKQSALIYDSEKQLKKFKARLDSVNKAYTQTFDEPGQQSLINLYKSTEKAQNDYLVTMLQQNSSSLVSLFFVDRLSMDNYFDTYKLVDDNLFKRFPENAYVMGFHNKVQGAMKLAIGGEAPEIALPDTSGNITKLSSLRGSYVLVDFWASWCGPCRRECPNFVRMYNLYKDKGFTIYSVSLDKTKEAWTNAIRTDKLTWTHVSDLKFWQCVAAQTYNVTSVPYTVLLDKQGKIIAKGLRGPDLEKKLEEIFGK